MSLQGKAFIVTGGCGSIGGATAKTILAKGGAVIVFDVLPNEAGQAKVKEYSADKAFYVKTDIAITEQVEAACAEALKVLPSGFKLWGGVHCAAIAPGRKWSHKLKDSIDDFAKVLNINAFGTFVVDACIADAVNSQYEDKGPFAERVKEERGVIVNIASVVANPVPARCITYGASKTAVLGISQGLADFLGPFGIRVCTVSPSVVASGLMGPDRIPYFESEIKASCIFPHRISVPQDVANGILFLIENGMMNDLDLPINAGWRASSNWGSEKDPRSNALSLE